jgi:hypothetical protein
MKYHGRITSPYPHRLSPASFFVPAPHIAVIATTRDFFLFYEAVTFPFAPSANRPYFPFIKEGLHT